MAITDPLEVRWRDVDSSNVAQVGWPKRRGKRRPARVLFVRFRNGQTYAYYGVSRQRAVAITRVESAGRYINRVIKPTFPSLRIPELD